MLTAAHFAFMQRMTDKAAPAAEETITFKRFLQDSPGNPAAGVSPSPVYDNAPGTDIPAVVNTTDEAVSDEPGGRVPVGGIVVMVRCSVLPAATWDNTTALDGADDGVTPPNENDRIVWKGSNYKPVRVTAARLRGALFWVLRCERL